MLGILFLFSVFTNGFFLNKHFLPKSVAPKWPAYFVIGSLFSVTIIFLLLSSIHSLLSALVLYFILSSILFIEISSELFTKIREYRLHMGDFIVPIIFSFAFILFEKSFSYDPVNHSFLIQSNLYQDFGAHIPVIRYFSNGQNFIPEVPFFAGAGLAYHFMFDFYAAILEYLGFRIDYAFNIISAFSFASLIFLLFEFASRLFKNKFVGILTPIFFIFISDLSFIQLFQKYGFSFSSFYHHNAYVFGEFMGLQIGRNFLNINTYLNQRHLVFALGVFIYILYLVLFEEKKLSKKSLIFPAILIGILPFWHLQILLALYVFLIVASILFEDLRTKIFKIIFLSAILVFPQLVLIKLNSVNQILFNPGFTIADNLSLETFLAFWIWNLGFAIPFAIFGLIKSDTFQKKIFLCFLSLFIVANLFQFGRDMFDNHKFFNAFLISINMFAGYGIYHLFRKGVLLKGVAVAGIILMTISGVSHMLVVKNDVYAKVLDSSRTKFGEWVKDNTKSQDIILTNGEIYDPVSIAGARTFLGRTHYIFLYGADPSKRILAKNDVLSGVDDKKVREILKENKITYIIIYKEGAAPNLTHTNNIYFNKNFRKVYEDNIAVIYKI